jgi:hypothetical protein
MTFKLYTDVALTHDLPKYRLCRGDLVRLVEHHVFTPPLSTVTAESPTMIMP